MLLLVPLTFAMVYNIPKFFELTTCDDSSSVTGTVVNSSETLNNTYHHHAINSNEDNGSLKLFHSTPAIAQGTRRTLKHVLEYT